eukprot:g1501.t1
MAGNTIMAPAERAMRETIEWLLALPAEQRERMAAAVSCAFSMEAPAPMWVGGVWGDPGQERRGSTILGTLNAGCVEAAELLCRLAPGSLRPALLNFAHGYNCGGGFDHSAGSQEEAIFRASSVFLSLWPHRRADDGPGVLARGTWIGDFDNRLPRREPYYPHSSCGGIYSPHVRLRSLGSESDHEDVSAMPCCAVLTVAAQDVGREPPFDAQLLREKARTILHMAATNGHNAVVLGAFGCGYFRNPAKVVAATFNELLRAGEFAEAFDVVVFAVPDRCGQNNFDEFASVFKVLETHELNASLRKSFLMPP